MVQLGHSLQEATRHTRSAHASFPAGQLMVRIHDGDAAALEQLMTRYWAGLVGYAARLLGCRDEATDVVQEVFVRTWERRRRWEMGGSAKSFLYRSARNLCLLQLRRRRVRARTAPEVRRRSRTTPTPIEEAVSGELQHALKGALGGLPERRREAFVLNRVEGMSLAAVAERMGVSKRTVSNHVYMATVELERALEPYVH